MNFQVDIDNVNVLEKLLNGVTQGVTPKELKGIPDELMEGLYAYAYDFYNTGRLDDAETFFRFLCVYDFYNADYFMGLAAVYQLKKQYQKAVDTYALAFALGKHDYRSLFFTGQCQLAMNQIENAKQCFALVDKNSDDEKLRTKAQVYLDTLGQSRE